jgi:hypothetical protein
MKQSLVTLGQSSRVCLARTQRGRKAIIAPDLSGKNAGFIELFDRRSHDYDKSASGGL